MEQSGEIINFINYFELKKKLGNGKMKIVGFFVVFFFFFFSNRVGLLLSEKKTKVMTCNVAPDPILTNGGIAPEEVEDFKYLGSWVNSSERDIKTRKALAWKALNSMKRV